jgi:hypothetical protein
MPRDPTANGIAIHIRTLASSSVGALAPGDIAAMVPSARNAITRPWSSHSVRQEPPSQVS